MYQSTVPYLAEAEGFEPPCLLGKRFSRTSQSFPTRPESSRFIPKNPPKLALSSQLPGKLRENCEKGARKRLKCTCRKCKTIKTHKNQTVN